jgi:outer membrane protein assembly factor BamD
MTILSRSAKLSAILLLVVAMSGCSGSGRLRYDSPKEAFDKGMVLYEAGKYDRAAEFFRGVFDFGRTHEYAPDAQLYLARSHAANKDLLLAANEYNRFVQLYRRDPRVTEAEYEMAMTYYARSPGYQLDQTDTKRAIEQLQLFIDRYPTDDRVQDAAQRINELREKLARKRHASALLYERRGLHEAAALTFESVFDDFPGSPWADDALLGAMRNYMRFSEQSIITRRPERLARVIANYERLSQIFPDSPVLTEAESMYEDALRRRTELGVSL